MAQEVGGSIPLGHPNSISLHFGVYKPRTLRKFQTHDQFFRGNSSAPVNEMTIERILKCLWVEVNGTLSSSSASSSIGRASDS